MPFLARVGKETEKEKKKSKKGKGKKAAG